MKLHYSQTKPRHNLRVVMFDYHMKLHYSQTGVVDVEYIVSKLSAIAPTGEECKVTVIIETTEKDG